MSIQNGSGRSSNSSSTTDTMNTLMEISSILGTGLNEEQLSISVRLIEMGVNPQALANVIRVLQRESAALGAEQKQMPIIVKDYTWDETPDSVAISVPLKGVKKEKVDIFSTDEYLKVSYPPYLFEIILQHPVNPDTSIARIDTSMVIFKLQKLEHGLWGQIRSNIMDDKAQMAVKREEILVKAREKAEADIQARNAKKRENEKHALNKAMQLDQEERDRITTVKEEEKRKATEELEKWKQEQVQSALLEKQKLAEEAELQATLRKQERIEERRRQKLKEKASKKGIFENQQGEVREPGKISVNFTPRAFPTAMRESTQPLEEEWLKKQAEARKIADIADEDLSEEERNPMFMKEKGDKFFLSGDFQAAINAYTHAIRLSQGKMPSLYSNRAACHLKIRNLIKAVEDSSKALELLTPPVPQNTKSRCRAHIRRGTAFCELELYVEGLLDYDAALKLEPDNEQLQVDADKVRKMIQGGADNRDK